MKIFFFTTYFLPSIGGIQQLAAVLCREWTAMGHEVRLATLVPSDDDSMFPYAVIRRPGLSDFAGLLRWCDVHVQANVSLKYAFARLLTPGRMVYQHNGVYRQDDNTLSALDRIKRLLARYTPGIANSHYSAAQLGSKYTLLNAYDDAIFTSTTPWDARETELAFLGRLVSQKGCDVLLRAMGRLRSEGLTPGLTVIGDGEDRTMLEALAATEGLSDQIRFAGTLQGAALAAELNRHRLLVVPSRYEEPFGIVALEGLACGCMPIVSAKGGLVDAIGPHGVTFPNGDDAALARAIAACLAAPAETQARMASVEDHLRPFTAGAVARRYIEIFSEITAGDAPS